MSDLREAAEMALEALEQTPTANKLFDSESYEKQKDAIDALRQALAQPEQEPETVMAKYEFQTYAAYKDDGEIKIGVVPEPTAWVTAGKHTVPLEVAPVDAVNMSQERVDETVKNRHEPVAWVNHDKDGEIEWGRNGYRLPVGTPLYAVPPKRKWVGLTEDETDGLIHLATYMDETDLWHLVSLVEERLKEKNNG